VTHARADEVVLTTSGAARASASTHREEAAQPFLPRTTSVFSFGTAAEPAVQVLPELGHPKSALQERLMDQASPVGNRAHCGTMGLYRACLHLQRSGDLSRERRVDVARRPARASRRRPQRATSPRGRVATTLGWTRRTSRSEGFPELSRSSPLLCGAHLHPVFDTLKSSSTRRRWVEIHDECRSPPGINASDEELTALSAGREESSAPKVPLHFTAFHPDFKMPHTPATPPRR